ncbi:MAG TPA: FlgD immunoglobulin-like domain containing protein, partial [Treponemataceae bacterium]|nr:FlgD immunoglobulin-like domain containing protein [Treponemataceae bacterium]
AKAKEVVQENGEGLERNFIIPNDSDKSDSFDWKDGDEVEFFFRYDDGKPESFTFDHDGNDETPEVPLYFFRLQDPKDPSSVDLWRFSLSDISRQRGGITILNNVINSLKKEETIVELDIKKAGNVTVHVLTLDGNIVKTLQRGRLNPGLHYFKWNGTNLSGTPVARGIYFMRVVGPDIDETRKVMVIKE